MQAILTANGYDVLMAGTGAMANTMISSHCPDLIILDLGLPDMDGMTILRSVREWSKVPILVVSARSHERGCQPARKMSAAACILIAVVLAVRGVIGMRGASHTRHGVVIAGTAVNVGNEYAKWRSRCPAPAHSAHYAEFIRLAPRRCVGAGRTAAGQKTGYLLRIDRKSGAKPVYHHAYRRAVALSEKRDRYTVSECVFHIVTALPAISSGVIFTNSKLPISSTVTTFMPSCAAFLSCRMKSQSLSTSVPAGRPVGRPYF